MTDTEIFNQELSKIQERQSIENTPEIMELRKLRDEANKISRDYQHQIDEKIKELHQVPDLGNKYIQIIKGESILYGQVKRVDRLYDGIRIYFTCMFSDNISYFGSIVIYINDGKTQSERISWNQIKNIEIITKEKFLDEFQILVDKFKRTI